jgi:hypothetical protein
LGNKRPNEYTNAYIMFAGNVYEKHRNEFKHQLIRDSVGCDLPVMSIPARMIPAFVREFMLNAPSKEEVDWIGYVIHLCVPRATELDEILRNIYGEDRWVDWLLDLYGKVLLVNPSLQYNIIKVILKETEKEHSENVVKVDFTKPRAKKTNSQS